MKWPDSRAIAAASLEILLREVDDLGEFRTGLMINEVTLQGWRNGGVPAGRDAALVRYFASQNEIELPANEANAATSDESGEPCLLCGGTSNVRVALSPVCRVCANHPEEVGERLGFTFHIRADELHSVLTVDMHCHRPFEFPVAARLTRERSGWFQKPDPEIGHPDFDDAVHIETMDYEALFDTLQLPRRRALVRDLAEFVSLELNVDHIRAVAHLLRRNVNIPRLKLEMVLLGWSLTNERVTHLIA